MTNIRLRRGNKSDLPASAPSGMPLWCEDTKELYMGTGPGVHKLETAGGSGGIPIGTVIPWTSTTIPEGFLDCNGQAVDRTGFSELFNIVGITFGAGNGSTTFNVPDLRGEFIRGLDRGKGVDLNRNIGTSQAQDWKSFTADTHSGSYNHQAYMAKALSLAYNANLFGGKWESPGSAMNIFWDGSEIRPRNVALVFIIKAKNVVGSDPAVQGANADTLDGFHSSAFSMADHSHGDVLFAHSGLNSGTTTYVYPPAGYTMSNLVAFIPSIRTIYFAGQVDGNDSLYCYWSSDTTKITLTCYNSEQRTTPTVNWLAIWRKNA